MTDWDAIITVVYDLISEPTNLVLSIVGYVLLCVVFGMIGVSITKYKSGGALAGFLLGFGLWVVGLLFCLLIPYKPIELLQTHSKRHERFQRSLSEGQKQNRPVQGEKREALLEKLDERTK